MSYEFDAPEAEEMSKGADGNFLAKPGQYHFTILDVKEGVGPKGKPIDGFCVQVAVLAGTTPDQVGKTANLMFFAPKLTSKDNGAFSRRKMTAFAIAANLIDPNQLGKRVSLELKNAVNHQFVAKMETSKSEDGKEYIDLAFADIWHVDDPRCAAVPKDSAALGLLPKELRHDAAWFETWLKPQAKSEPKAESKATAAAGVSFDDL